MYSNLTARGRDARGRHRARGRQARRRPVRRDLSDALHTATLGFGRIVVSDIEVPILLMNLV